MEVVNKVKEELKSPDLTLEKLSQLEKEFDALQPLFQEAFQQAQVNPNQNQTNPNQ